MAEAFEAVQERQHVGASDFRTAMSRLGAAVNVVSTDGRRGKGGCTATAMVSISDAPPTIMVCIFRKASCAEVMRENGIFCVNTLRAADEPIAEVFAGRTAIARDSRFEEGRWCTLVTGAPVLSTAIVAFDCRITEVKSVASHDLFFGVVEALRIGANEPILVYHERTYKYV